MVKAFHRETNNCRHAKLIDNLELPINLGSRSLMPECTERTHTDTNKPTA